MTGLMVLLVQLEMMDTMAQLVLLEMMDTMAQLVLLGIMGMMAQLVPQVIKHLHPPCHHYHHRQ